jgi:hypothetical protein
VRITLDDALAARLRTEASRRGLTLKEALRLLVLRALSLPDGGGGEQRRLRVRTFRSPLRPGVDPSALNRLADDLDKGPSAGRSFARLAGAVRGPRSLSKRKGFRKP